MRTPVSTLINAVLSFTSFILSAEFIDEIEGVRELFNNHSIPQNLNITFNPDVLLDVIYQQPEGLPIVVTPGQTLQVNQTAIPPTFSIAGRRADPSQAYVVTMFDLDAPDPQDPSLSPIRHFLGSDFYAFTPKEYDYAILANTSEAMSFYVQPAPTAGSAPHRYVWLIWDQPPGFDNQTYFPHIYSMSDPDLLTAENFNLTGFREATGLGEPIGGSFAMIGPQD